MAVGYRIYPAIRSLLERFPDNELCQKLSSSQGKSFLDLVAKGLIDPKTQDTFASIFAPILLDSFHRILRQNGPKLSLFCTLAKLHGRYACATKFCHDCFNRRLFDSENLLKECTDESLLNDFFESCLILLNYDIEFYSIHFDWKFLGVYLNDDHFDGDYFDYDNYIQCLAKKIYCKIARIPKKYDGGKYRLKLASLSCRYLQYLPEAIQYGVFEENQDGHLKICDEDFVPEVVPVQGILLPKLQSHCDESVSDNNRVPLPSFEKTLRLLALGVSLASQPILVQGPMACGKSTLIRHLAHVTGRRRTPQIQTIQISDQVDTKFLLGSYVCTDVPGEFRFNFGPLLMAARDGNWIILEDVDSASSDLISSLVSIIESSHGSQISGYENKIDSFHPDFRVFFTRTLDDSSSIGNVNFKMLEKMCYTVTMENFGQEEIAQLIQEKWPNLRVLVPRIVQFYQELNSPENRTGKRRVTLHDLTKWCRRFSSYFQPDKASVQKMAFLDAIDCFVGFQSYRDSIKETIYLLGSNFNLSQPECQQLLEHRSPTIIKNKTLITIGRESMSATHLSQNVPDFAFTLGTTQLLEKLFACIKRDEPVLLCGETGVGKTSSIQYLANLCGRQLTIVNMNQQSNSTELFGGYKPVDFEHVFNVTKNDYLWLFGQTFNEEKNVEFKKKFDQLWQKQDWKTLIHVMMHVCRSGQEKTKKNKIEFSEKWIDLEEKLKKYLALIENHKQLTFMFVEGVLTHAIRTGQWILLDEINLSENETLQSLLSFLENDKILMLFEKFQDQLVHVHQDFRLFACMNPATDVGKKELPRKIRSRFTEFFIDDVKDRTQLRIIVNTYIQTLVNMATVEAIVQFYFRIKEDADSILKDMNGHRPVFSLRNLCRALRVAKSNPFKSIQRSLYEAFCLSFLSNLDEESYRTVQNRIESILFSGVSLTKMLSAPLNQLFSSQNYVLVQNYPIMKGPEEPIEDPTYILTETVKRNLTDICRIISAGKTYPILIQGETSVGKTSMIQWLAKATGNVCHRVNNHEHTDLQEYVGSYCSESDGRIVFRTGILVEAMKNGHWIILDELNLAPTEVLEALNRVLDDNREIFIPETQEIIQAHPRFLLFATQNPPGKYGGRKILSRAFRNRFIELNFNEIPLPELEVILHKKCLIPMSYAKRMVSVLSQLQKCRCKSDIFAGKHGFITLRDLFRWGYRYRKFAANQDSQVKFFDWNLFLANQGYMLLAGRVRNQDDAELIKKILEDSFRCKICLEDLFYRPSTDFECATPAQFSNIVWTKAFRRLGTLLQQAILYQEPVLLVGETGCGKTTICQYFAALREKTLKIINCHMNTESSDFLGSLRPNRNPDQSGVLFEWVDGPLINAMKSGDYFLVDEISLADDSVLERLNSVLEPERSIFLAEKSGADHDPLILADQEFRYFATMNPGGDYGKKELSPALRDRFTEIWCPAFEDIVDVEKIVFHNLKIQNDSNRSLVSQSICSFLEWFNDKISSTVTMKKRTMVSIRDIISWVQFINSTALMPHKCLSLRDSFIHGAYSVFIDSLGASQNFRFALNFDVEKTRSTCQQYLETLTKKIPNDEEKIIELSTDDYFKVGPFPVERGNCPKKEPSRLLLQEDSYYWDSPGILENLKKIGRALQLDKPILLEGPPGVGKTTLVQALANITGHQLIRINLSDQTDISDLFGCDLPREGEGNAGKFTFCDGPFLAALKSDFTWILLDELNLASQTVLEGLNACLDHRGEIYVAELNKTFQVNKRKTRIFASQNPFSMDGTRKGLPRSFLNRFTTVYVRELDDEDFKRILDNSYGSLNYIQKMVSVNRHICEKVRQDGSFAKNGGPFEFNLRDLIRWLKLTFDFEVSTEGCESPELFFNLIYTGKMRTEQDQEKMAEIYQEEFSDRKPKPKPIYYLGQKIFQFGFSIFTEDISSINQFNDQTINYLFDGQKVVLESILKCIQMKWLTILVGGPGCGKTHLIRMIADLFGKRLNVLHVSPEMDTIDLLGGFEQKDFSVDQKRLEKKIVEYGFECLAKSKSKTAASFLSIFYCLNKATGSEKFQLLKSILNIFQRINPVRNRELEDEWKQLERQQNSNSDQGTFEWRDSSLVESIQRGDWVLIDNANFLNPAVLDRLNSLLEPKGSLMINERGSVNGTIATIYPHKDFQLFLAMNPHHGELSRAMRNRGIEIAMNTKMDREEMKAVTLNHGFQMEETLLDSFNDFDSFFKFVTESILKNQHGFAPDMTQLKPFSGIITDILIAQPIKLNCLAQDPELFRGLQDLSVLRPFDDPTQMRLWFENSTFDDFDCLRTCLLTSSDYKNDANSKWLRAFRSKIFDYITFDSSEIDLQFNFQENFYLEKMFESIEVDEYPGKVFQSLEMLWIDLNQRLSAQPFAEIRELSPLDDFYYVTNLEIQNLIDGLRNSSLEEARSYDLTAMRNSLISLYRLLSCSRFEDKNNWQQSFAEKFVPMWYVVFQERCFEILFSGSMPHEINLVLKEINKKFSINSDCPFEISTYLKFRPKENLAFCCRTMEDIQVFKVYRKISELFREAAKNPVELAKLNQSCLKVTKSMVDYFQKDIDYENICIEFSIQYNFWNKQISMKRSSATINPLSTCFQILTNLFSWINFIDTIVNEKPRFDVPDLSKSNFFVDPNLLLLDHYRLGKYTDVLEEMLAGIGRDWKIRQLFDNLNLVDKVKGFENLKDGITYEFLPIFSVIFSQVFGQQNDSFRVFGQKRTARESFQKLLNSNYFSIRYLNISECYNSLGHWWNQRFELDQGNERISKSINLIRTGYQIARTVIPYFEVDPVVVLRALVENYDFRKTFTERELDLRHKLYQKNYGYHPIEFNSDMFKSLRKEIESSKDHYDKYRACDFARDPSVSYHELKTLVKRFDDTVMSHQVMKMFCDDVDDWTTKSSKIIPKCANILQTINNFIKTIRQYVGFRDLTTNFLISMQMIAKGLQMILAEFCLSCTRDDMMPFSPSAIKYVPGIINWLAPFFKKGIFSENINRNQIRLLLTIYKEFDLCEHSAINRLFKILILEMKNSIALVGLNPKLLSLYFQLVEEFVQQWKMIEKNKELDQIQRDALFHIKLENNDSEKDEALAVEEIFPSFRDVFHDLIDDGPPKEHPSPPIKNGNETMSKEILILIARSHIDMTELLENGASKTEFKKSYLIGYQIVTELLQLDLGLTSGQIDPLLIDGHLISSSDRNESEEGNSLNIYHESVSSQTEKCYKVLESLRIKIVEELLPEFENHPALLKMVQIIERIYEIKADSSLVCLATGLELVLKASEEWQQIAHRGISLVTHQNEITELLVSWRKMEINYWANCLETASKQIEEKELFIWWIRFFTTIEDLVTDKNGEETKDFINNVKKLMEHSTLGQFFIRLKIIRAFICHVKHCDDGNFVDQSEKLRAKTRLESLEISLRNIHDFYDHFSDSIAKRIEQEKNSFEKEIKQFVTISKWNPNNFWSLKESLARSKKQLYGYIKKYELALSKPANEFFRFESKVREPADLWKIPVKLKRELSIDVKNYQPEQFTTCPILSNADSYIKRTISVASKIERSIRHRVQGVNCMEELNLTLISSIQEYSNLKVNETKDLEKRKKLIAQIQTRKRRAISDLFKALRSRVGLSFRRGTNKYEQFEMDKTIYSIRAIDICMDAFPEQTQQDVRSCNTYFYRCLAHYSQFLRAMEKPNEQLTLDMIDRIKGYVVDLARTVVDQRRIISQFTIQFENLFNQYSVIKKNFNPDDRLIFSLGKKFSSLETFRNGQSHLELLSHLIRMKIHAESLSSVSDFDADNLDGVIEAVKNIKHSESDQIPFFTESNLEAMKQRAETYLDIIRKVKEFFVPKHQDLALIYTGGEGLGKMEDYHVEILQELNNCLTNTNAIDDSGINSDCLKTCEPLVKQILLSFQKMFKLFLDEKPEIESETDQKLIRQISFAKVLKRLNPYQIHLLMKEFFAKINHGKEESANRSRSTVQLVALMLPFLDLYLDLTRFTLVVLFRSLKTSSKMLDILLSLFNEILANGFCLPPDLQPEKASGDQRKNMENSGFGEGETTSDAQDVSDRLDCQDQLDDLDLGGDDQQNDQEESLENAENGIEMDEDFEGQEHGADKTEQDNDDDGEEETEDDQDLMEQMGDVEDNEQVLDENLWGDQDDEDEQKEAAKEEEEIDQNSGGKEQLDSRTVADKDNENLNQQKEQQELDNCQMDDNDQDDDGINENYNDEDDSKDVRQEKQPEMVLPDNIELDMDGDGDDDQEDMETASDKDDKAENENDDGENVQDIDVQDDNADDQEEAGDSDGDDDRGRNDLADDQNEEENGDEDGKEPVGIAPRQDDLNDDCPYANTDFQNNGGQTDQEDKKDNKQATGNNQSVEPNSNATAKLAEDQPKTSGSEQNDGGEEDREYSMTRQNQKRSVADHVDENTKRRKIIKEENATEQPASDQFKHTEAEKTNEQAFDLANGDDQKVKQLEEELERGVNINQDERHQQDQDVVMQDIANASEKANDSTKVEKEEDQQGVEKMIHGDLVTTSGVDRPIESTFHSTHDRDDFKPEPGQEDQHDAPEPMMVDLAEVKASESELWQASKQRIESLLYELCNQLQLVLEPTKRSKYQGDFKTGKRLNMKKVITYVASQFRKDKIWLRRMRPSKRQYQIIISVDDSLSMFDNQSRTIALESLILIGKALSIIESGLLSVLSFGEQVRILHRFGQPFTDEAAGKIFEQFTFEQRRTKTNEMLRCALAMFGTAATDVRTGSSTTNDQLLIIISDGRGVCSEGAQDISQTLVRIKERNIFTVFIIVDNPEHRSSILDIRIPIFKPDGSMEIVSYMEKFPFPYYVILKDVQALPAILGEALRQWFELISYN